ncbi:hypothetical protein YC2023_042471 [Brassica napus]
MVTNRKQPNRLAILQFVKANRAFEITGSDLRLLNGGVSEDGEALNHGVFKSASP